MNKWRHRPCARVAAAAVVVITAAITVLSSPASASVERPDPVEPADPVDPAEQVELTESGATATAGTIVVRAGGTTGAEALRLEINGEVVTSWTGLSSTPTELTAEVTEPVVIDRLRVLFTNDRRGVGGDRDVVIDWVEVAGQRFESEDPANRSAGGFSRGAGCSEGYKRIEVLHCSGWIEYAGAVGLTTGGAAPTPVIFDTDMGPDVDDALALAMLHGYEREGLAEILAVTVSRSSVWGARYSDLLNTFYGRPDIPIGTYRGRTPADGSDHRWSRPVVESGRYDHDVHLANDDGEDEIGVGARVMREALAGAADGSVVIIQTGFAGNLAELLATGPDEISPLTGPELVEAKVRLVSIMGGDNGVDRAEFNVTNDIASARTVFDETPVPIVQSEYGLGRWILYPLSSIQNDFDHAPDHPIPVSYLWSDLSWHDDEADRYNMRTWDLTSVMTAIEPGRWFERSTPGLVTVDDEGRTTFVATAEGNVTTIDLHAGSAEADRAAIVDRMIELVAAPID